MFLFVRLSLCLFIALPAVGQLGEMRELYFAAGTSAGITQFRNRADHLDERDPVLRAYKGVAYAMYAEVANGPARKFEWFGRGKQLIESACTAEPSNPEIAFLRFSVQSEAPWIVDYRSHTQSDAQVIRKALQQGKISARDRFWQRALQFMVQSDALESTERSEFRNYLSS